MHRGDGEQGPKQPTRKKDLLCRHDLRPEWGWALLAWERGDKRGYQFEDGRLRVFKKGYYDRLTPAETPPEEGSRILAALRRRVGWKEQAEPQGKAAKVTAVPVEEQVALFARLYPKGFVGARWARDVRGIDTMRRLKRHREGSILDAARLLSQARLEGLAAVGKHGEIVESMRVLCDGTDLITKAQRRALDGLDDAGARRIAESLVDLLYGAEAEGIRFERFVDVLARVTGSRPTWQLATVFLALAQPKEHLCIKPGAMRTQVACAGRLIKISAVPDAPTYERLRTLAVAIRDHLVDAGHAPRDLLDVTDFIALTTSSKALRQMQAENGPAHAQFAA